MYNHEKTAEKQLILQQAELFVADALFAVSLLANITALLLQYYHDVNWLGFYLADQDRLYLGPFQGKSACQIIPFGKGVCGTAAASRQVQIVKDVRQLENHIACDSESLSEIVVPLVIADKVYGVLDIDAPTTDYFDEEDQAFLLRLLEVIKPGLINAR